MQKPLDQENMSENKSKTANNIRSTVSLIDSPKIRLKVAFDFWLFALTRIRYGQKLNICFMTTIESSHEWCISMVSKHATYETRVVPFTSDFNYIIYVLLNFHGLSFMAKQMEKIAFDSASACEPIFIHDFGNSIIFSSDFGIHSKLLLSVRKTDAWP